MKREDLKKLELTGEQIDAIMDLHGTDAEAHKAALAKLSEQVATLTSERDGLATQVKERDADIKQLKEQSGNSEALNQKLTDLQTKYETDTAKLKQTLADQALDHAVADYFGKITFTSALAKRAAIADFKATKPELKDGKFPKETADSFVKQLQEQNPDAFPKADDNGGQGGNNPNLNQQPNKLPQFTAPLKPNEGKPDDGKTFNFGFTPLRTPDKK